MGCVHSTTTDIAARRQGPLGRPLCGATLGLWLPLGHSFLPRPSPSFFIPVPCPPRVCPGIFFFFFFAPGKGVDAAAQGGIKRWGAQPPYAVAAGWRSPWCRTGRLVIRSGLRGCDLAPARPTSADSRVFTTASGSQDLHTPPRWRLVESHQQLAWEQPMVDCLPNVPPPAPTPASG